MPPTANQNHAMDYLSLQLLQRVKIIPFSVPIHLLPVGKKKQV